MLVLDTTRRVLVLFPVNCSFFSWTGGERQGTAMRHLVRMAAMQRMVSLRRDHAPRRQPRQPRQSR